MKYIDLRGARAVCGGLSLVLGSIGSAGADSITGPMDAQHSDVCMPAAPGSRDSIVNRDRMLNWLDVTDKLSIGNTVDPASGQNFKPVEVFADDNVLARFRNAVNPTDTKPEDLESTRKTLAGKIRNLHTQLSAAGQLNVGASYRGTLAFNTQDWLKQPSAYGPVRIYCTAPAAQETLPAFLKPFRIRGTTDTLTSSRDDAAFLTATPATISFAYDGLGKTRTDVFQAAVGYDFLNAEQANVKNYNSLVGYAAGSRNVTTTAGMPSKFNVEYADIGLIAGHTDNEDNFANIASVSTHFLINTVDDSRLFGIHAVEEPIILNQDFPLNFYWFLPGGSENSPYAVAVGPLWDLRADAGFYTDRGLAPTTNVDYFRLGSRFGAAAQIPGLRSSITVADTWMYGFSGSQQRLNDFQASWTFHLDPEQKYFGLSFGYKIGRIEATAQKEQSWLVSLTGKY